MPAFRVHFWDEAGARVSEYDVTGADVDTVLAWAASNTAEGGGFVLYLVVHDGRDGPGLCRLAGRLPSGSA